MLEHDIILSQAQANLDAIPLVFAMTLDLAGYNHLQERINRLVRSSMLMTKADIGMLFLHKEQYLGLATVQFRDSLDDDKQYLYRRIQVPINAESFAGTSASQGKILLFKDVELRNICAWAQDAYRQIYKKDNTVLPASILCIPLLDEYEKLLGVLQLVNGKNALFFDQQYSWLGMLQSAAVQALDQGICSHNSMMRTLGMVQLHDHRETLAHVRRMGAMAAEIYQALHSGEHPDQVAKYRDYIRVAVMYHDLGKVAVPGDILQKAGPLDLREFINMQSHTIKGAALFAHDDSELARICMEVLLNHHEHWDGSGYPGHFEAHDGNNSLLGPGKRGDEIPQSARIASLVDFYDTFSSCDMGTDPWPEDELLTQIKESAGLRFDPQAVRAFLQVYGIIQAIKRYYAE